MVSVYLQHSSAEQGSKRPFLAVSGWSRWPKRRISDCDCRIQFGLRTEICSLKQWKLWIKYLVPTFSFSLRGAILDGLVGQFNAATEKCGKAPACKTVKCLQSAFCNLCWFLPTNCWKLNHNIHGGQTYSTHFDILRLLSLVDGTNFLVFAFHKIFQLTQRNNSASCCNVWFFVLHNTSCDKDASKLILILMMFKSN